MLQMLQILPRNEKSPIGGGRVKKVSGIGAGFAIFAMSSSGQFVQSDECEKVGLEK